MMTVADTRLIADEALRQVGFNAFPCDVVEFRAMGTAFEVTCVGGRPDVLLEMQRLAGELESKWTRFDDDSELMTLNNHPDEWISVSSETVQLVQAMVDGWRLTGYLFDPNMLAHMIDLGFAASQDDSDRVTRWRQRLSTGNSMDAVRIDAAAGAVFLPCGVGLDAGGIGKGLAADLMAQRALEMGAAGVAVFAGGEVRVSGAPPRGDEWRIGVEHPDDEDLLVDVLGIIDGGVATSGVRGWTTQGGHHIIDPRTGRSTDSGTVQATVVTGECVDAEVLAKACMVLPAQDAVTLADRVGAQALILDSDLFRYATSGWAALCT